MKAVNRPFVLLLMCSLFGLLAALLLTTPVAAQEPPFDDPEARLAIDILPDVTARPPVPGPAWWRAAKGESTVWILGWPPSYTSRLLRWDASVLERRLKGARVLLTPPSGLAQFSGEWTTAIPPDLARRARSVAPRLGWRYDSDAPITAVSIVRLTGLYQKSEGIDFHVPEEIEAVARRVGAPISTSEKFEVKLGPDDWDTDHPATRACLTAMLEEVEANRLRYVQSANYWARGQVAQALDAAPRGSSSLCSNLIVPGFSRHLIEVQTAAIAAALEVPGKAIAVAPMRQLLAEEGILVRLRAQGFTITSPVETLKD